VPIGRAVDHVRVVVLNSDKDDVCALGVPGELAFIGDVAFGYLNNVEATAKAFSKAPAKLARNESDRMYRTGDVVRYSGNELRFLGRQDRQIKLRGLRIELGEIESKLNQIQGVKESVCTTIGTGASMALVAYARTTLDSDILRDVLAKALPKYMVPSQIICVSEFPRTDRGKLDTKKLPSVKRHASEKPSSELEASLATIFAEVLGIDSVGRDDDFETLGGNSLLAGRTTNLIRRRVEGASRIPGTTLYKHPTVKSLARVITEERSRHVQEAPVPLVSDTTYHARDPTRCVSLLIQIVGVVTFLGMRYMDWPAWYVLWYLSASRRVVVFSLLQYDSCPSHDDVGGLFFEFEAIRTELRCSAQVPVPVAAQGLCVRVRALLLGIDGFRGVFVRLGGAEGATWQ